MQINQLGPGAGADIGLMDRHGAHLRHRSRIRRAVRGRDLGAEGAHVQVDDFAIFGIGVALPVGDIARLRAGGGV